MIKVKQKSTFKIKTTYIVVLICMISAAFLFINAKVLLEEERQVRVEIGGLSECESPSEPAMVEGVVIDGMNIPCVTAMGEREARAKELRQTAAILIVAVFVTATSLALVIKARRHYKEEV